MADTKRQHYIPRFYLSGFASVLRKGQLCVYEKGSQNCFFASPENVAHEKYFYAYEDDDGTRDTQVVEKWLANTIENPANPIINKIRLRQSISPEEKLTLSVYMNVMLKRTPAHRQKAKALLPSVALNLMEQIKRGEGPELPTDAHRDIALKMMERYAEEKPDRFTLPDVSEKIVEVIYNLTWKFFTSPGLSGFLTCDNPIFFHESIGIGDEKSEIVFPISSTVTLYAARRPDWFDRSFTPVDEGTKDEINRRIVHNSHRHVFHHSEAAWAKKLMTQK